MFVTIVGTPRKLRHQTAAGVAVAILGIAGCGSDDGSPPARTTSAINHAQPGLSLVAGNVGGCGSLDGQGSEARFRAPSAVALDSAGVLYIADGSTVREQGTSGLVTTIAGSATETVSVDGIGSTARFVSLSGIAVDAGNNLLVVDSVDNTLRVVNPLGAVSTLAGVSGVPGYADGPLAQAKFNAPNGIAIDPTSGSIYIADSGNSAIRKISNGVASTLAGVPGLAGEADGSGTNALFNYPTSISVDVSGNLFVVDARSALVRKITPTGVVTTFAGNPSPESTVPMDGVGVAANFSYPSSIAIDPSANLFVGESFEIRKIDAAAVVTTVAGGTTPGQADGTGVAARFLTPVGVVADTAGALFVADRDNCTIRRVSTAAVVSTVAGSPVIVGAMDGTGAAATFYVPQAVAVDAAQNIYVVDAGDFIVRRITAGGVVTTLAGKSGLSGTADGTGSAARFASPNALTVDTSGNLYIADGNRIRKVTATGVVTTVAGQGAPGGNDGPAALATFNEPQGIAVDSTGVIYVSDGGSIRTIANGIVATIAGAYQRFDYVDGPAASASFESLGDIAVDAAGNVYVTETYSATVRKLTTGGIVSTIAGAKQMRGSVDGRGGAARFIVPLGIVSDNAGNLFVSDAEAGTIRRIDAGGNVTTVAGVADGLGGVRLGVLPGHLAFPRNLAIDHNGVLYVPNANGVIRITLQ